MTIAHKHSLTIFLTIISISASCQTLIPQAGLTFSTSNLRSRATKPHHTDNDFRQGYMAGVAIQFPIHGQMNMQVGVFYIQKGSKSNHLAQNSTEKAIHRFDLTFEYVEVPIQFRFNLNESERTEFYLRAGPGIAYWIGGDAEIFYSYTIGSTAPDQGLIESRIKYDGTRSGPIADDYYITRRLEASVHLGLGMVIRDKINIDIGGIFGLSEQEFFFDAMARNIVMQCSIGFPLMIKPSKD